MEQRLMKLDSAALYLGIGITTLKNLVRAKKIAKVKVGYSTLFDRRELDRFVDELSSPSAANQ